jgi:hypothetical protein
VDAIFDAPVGADGGGKPLGRQVRRSEMKRCERVILPSRSTSASTMAILASPGITASPE